MSVIIETSLGDFTIDLFTDERPKCCKNFLKLCKVKYYNFCLFHSVQRNFIAQTGDPDGNGRGGESIYGTLYGEQARYFDWEFVPKIKHVKRGLVSMVNNGNNMHGSQFFLTLGDSLDYLDGVHTVIGEITEGLEVIQKLNEAYCDEKFKPFRDIRIHHTIILEDPFEDPPGLDMPDRSPSPPPAVIERARLAADAEIDDLEGMTEEEIREIMEEREEKANAQLLEMIGDLPSTDITAPENILFVCKLNSVTTDEDLEIIFSRFGTIKSCEVIRDQKTGESLQYAFIEFEKKKDCESAYFKMDNVLIDDRRIHVDFSQSVSKVKWKGKGKGVETIKEDPKKPKYTIKDKSQRQDNNYELVFEENGDNKSSKKKHKDRSHDREDDYRNKKKHRSRSRSPHGRKYRSPERNRRNERVRSNDRRNRYSPQRSRGERYRQRSPPRGRGDNYFTPPRNWDDRNSPPRQRERQVDRHRSPAPRDRGKEERNNSRLSEVRDKKTNKKKYESSDNESLDRQKDRKKKRHASSSDDESRDRLKSKKKKRHSGSSDNESRDRQKSKKKKRYSVSSEDESLEREKSKKKKRVSVSSDEDERKKSKKKKTKKNDSSDEDEHIHRKKKNKKDQFSDDSDDKESKSRKKKRKKKKYDSSSEEEPVKHSKKKQYLTNSKSDSESPHNDRKYSSDKYQSKSVKDYRESDERRDNHRKRERDEYKEKRR